jgi:Rad3-related DNA helicase
VLVGVFRCIVVDAYVARFGIRGCQICPFFLTRNMLPEAEIVFVPYNYLIDPMARRSIGISIENSILIFDEAHNVVG